MTAMIELEGFSVGWGRRQVLSGLDLHVAPGETLTIVGPGGSGKSTLLEALDRLIAPQTTPPGSELWWRGQARIRARSCERLVQYGSFASGRARDLLERIEPDSVATFCPDQPSAAREYAQSLDRPLARLPDPVRRYLSFVITATAEDEILMFDEPLHELPALWAELITLRLQRLAASSRTVVVVTHYLPLARQISDRVALLVDGELIEIAPKTTFFSKPERARTRNFIQYGS